MAIWNMVIACWIPKAINTRSEYIILIAFPRQQWLCERAPQYYLYTYIVCVVVYGLCNNTVSISEFTETKVELRVNTELAATWKAVDVISLDILCRYVPRGHEMLVSTAGWRAEVLTPAFSNTKRACATPSTASLVILCLLDDNIKVDFTK